MSVSEQQTFRIPVSNGLLEHCAEMGEAIWYFLWCVDKTTKEKDDDDGTGNFLGSVLGGMPINDSDVALALGKEVKTIRRWRNHLTEKSYLKTQRTPIGYRVWVKKSKKKWVKADKGLDKNVQSDRTKMSNQSESDLPLGEIRKDISGSRLPEKGNLYRPSSDSIETKQERGEAKPPRSSSEKPKAAGRSKGEIRDLLNDVKQTALRVNEDAIFSSKQSSGIKQVLEDDPDLAREEILEAVRNIVSRLDEFQLKNCGSHVAEMLAPTARHIREERDREKRQTEMERLAIERGHAQFLEEEAKRLQERAEEEETSRRLVEDSSGLFGGTVRS
jgi:hypothetical protein